MVLYQEELDQRFSFIFGRVTALFGLRMVHIEIVNTLAESFMVGMFSNDYMTCLMTSAIAMIESAAILNFTSFYRLVHTI